MLAFTTTNVLAILIGHVVADKNGLTKSPHLGIMLHVAITLTILLGHVAAVNNGLARVPQLGWVRRPFRSICK
jgi:hypothetical protein